ncbi:hypothetical protein LQE92_09665 [Lacrimispora sp. NSJ-141]|uniref:Uncharacterized protein n=1 Tax=Lientehia hominis TaxID=2897778 RepID=A0AAP2WAB2_9FIRM|nr:hypothetical protein [Lientehia hominis]MCD2492894.1 hypothetical protein [Lientehia hominis]
MKTTYELIRYHFHSYFKSSRFVMPVVILAVVLYCMYTIMPVGIVDSFSISSVCLFLIMVWAGLSYNMLEDPVSEQLMILRVRSDITYYLSCSLFLILLGMLACLISTLFPVIQNLLNHRQLFLRPIKASDILCGWLLQSASAFVGSSVGALLHPRIMKDRKIAISLTAFIAVMAVSKFGILQEIPASRSVLWIFPPMEELNSIFAGEETYSLLKVLEALGILCLYGTAVSALRIWLLKKRKF